MATQQEIMEQGIRREVKMMAVHTAQELIADLGRIARGEGDDELFGICVTFIQGANELMQGWNEENRASFEAFEANQSEVDQLEAMLALGGEELGASDDDS